MGRWINSTIDYLFVFCASLKLAVVTLSVLTIVLGAATFYEKYYGTDAVQVMIYQSWWFAGLLGALAVNIFTAAAIRFPWKRHQTGFVITHAGLLTLLLGCVIGFHRSLDGLVDIVEGESSNSVRVRSDQVMLAYADGKNLHFASLPVTPIGQGPYPTFFRFMVTPRLWSFAKPMWPAGQALPLSPSAEFVQAVGQPVKVELVNWYHSAEPSDGLVAGKPGDPPAVRVVLDGTFPGQPVDGPVQVMADQWVLAPHGHEHPPAMVGPMGVAMVTLDNQAQVDAFLAYDAQQELPPGARGLIEIAQSWDGRLFGRRSSTRGMEWSQAIEVGKRYPAFMTMYFRVAEHLPSASEEAGFKRLDTLPSSPGNPAMQVRVTVGDHSETMWLSRDGGPAELHRAVHNPATRTSLSIAYVMQRMPLGYALHLDRFERGLDPGTNNSASFASNVQLRDPHENVDRPVRIYMNNPLYYRGLTFYQSSYQPLPDGRTLSVLSVNRDPGRPIKYAGCTLVVVGIFTMFYMRAYFFKARNKAVSPAGKAPANATRVSTATTAALLAALLITHSNAWAQPTTDPAAPAATAAPTTQPAPAPAPTAKLPPTHSSRLAPATLESLRHIPIIYDGRIMPLDTMARQAVRQITGRTNFGIPVEEHGELEVHDKLDPVEFTLAVMADPGKWADAPIIRVDLLELREFLKMPATHTHIAPRALRSHEEFQRLSMDARRRRGQAQQDRMLFEASKLEHAMMEVAAREDRFKQLFRGAGMGVLPYPDDDAFYAWLEEQLRTGHPTPAAEAALNHWVQLPAVSEKFSEAQRRQEFIAHAGWLPLDLLFDSGPQGLPPNVSDRWSQAGALWARALRSYRDNKEPDAAMASLAAGLPALTLAAPPPGAIEREVFYNGLHPFRWSMAFYFLAAVVLLVAVQIRRPFIYVAGMTLLVAAILVHIFGFYLRVLISGFAPVTNMYETVIWVAVFCAVLGFGLELIYRWRLIALSAAAVAMVCTLVADIMPPSLGAEFRNLQPVLRDNFWLSTHVTTIVSSYAAFALALGLGNVALGYYLFAPGRASSLRNLNNFTYRAMQVGVLLVAAGTILGGVWADVSWGRFWGWDPKEVWALIVLLTYLIILHGRYAGWVGQFGLAAGAVLAFQSVIMAWYGVNFVLGAGLHSYGFGSGGILPMAIYVGVQCAFVAAAALRYNLYKSEARARHAAEEVAGSKAVPQTP